MVSNEAAERFLNATWLSELDSSGRLALLNLLEEGRAEAGTVLLAQDRENHRLFFLIEGSVSILRSYPNRKDEHVATLHAPSGFGETSFFRGRPSIVSVRAEEPVLYLTLDRQAHARLRRSDPKTAEGLALTAVRVLAERFDLLDRRVSDFLDQQPDEPAAPPRRNEWSAFRARLFEEPQI